MHPNSVILTGATGFLGSMVKNSLISSGYKTYTVGRSLGNDLISDINDNLHFPESLEAEMVIHSAGKAHVVPRTKEEAEAFFSVNFLGTKNLCNALEYAHKLPQSFVFISTVAVYNSEGRLNTREDAPLNGTTPYAKSKIAAENWLIEWCDRNGVRLAILRLPLIAGPHPPGNLDTMIKGINTGRYFRIGKGAARKSIVLASDVAEIIPKAAEVGGIYNLTDGYHPSFAELEVLIAKQLRKPTPMSIPMPLAKALGFAGDILGRRFPVNSDTIRKMTTDMTFDDAKARSTLGWAPRRVLDHFEIG